MRTLLLVLIAANAIFFAVARGYLGLLPDSREPERMARQIQPERLRLLAREPELEHAAAGEAAKPPANGAAASIAPPPAANSASTVCVEYGGFNAEDGDAIAAELGARLPAAAVTPRTAVETTSYMVFVPPSASREEAVRAAAELKRLGVGDYFVIDASAPHGLGISLGVLPTEKMAQAQLAALVKKGVSNAQIAGRTTPRVWLQIRAADAGLRELVSGKIGDLRAKYPTRELRDCPTETAGG